MSMAVLFMVELMGATILGFDETRVDRRMVIILKSSLLFGAVTTESRH
jgi:hypothetical protein